MFGKLFKKNQDEASSFVKALVELHEQATSDLGSEKVLSTTLNGWPVTVKALAYTDDGGRDPSAPEEAEDSEADFTRVYIAATDARLARLLADVVDAEPDLAVASDWHGGDRGRLHGPDDVDVNLGQILDSDVFVLCSHFGPVPGSKFVEAGFALAHGIPVVLWGERENSMLKHRLVTPVYSDDPWDVIRDVRRAAAKSAGEDGESSS